MAAARHSYRVAALAEAIEAQLDMLDGMDFVPRLLDRDVSLWTTSGADPADIRSRLGWLDLPAAPVDVPRPSGGPVLLVGMGGSSLGAAACAGAAGAADLRLVDTTIPDALRELTNVDLDRTVIVVASKSGTTLETLAVTDWLQDRAAGTHASFVAITDLGTPLEDRAARPPFTRTWLGEQDVGGRFSVLSAFGMVPASLAGVDVVEVQASAAEMAAGGSDARIAGEHPGALLGAILCAAAAEGRDKLTVLADPGLGRFGDWLEQLVAESTGKEGRGLVPIVREPVFPAHRYGDDRLLAIVRWRAGSRYSDTFLEEMETTGLPVLVWDLDDAGQLGGEFVRWQTATATAGALMAVNPFDQPDVESAKSRTRKILDDGGASARATVEVDDRQHDAVRCRADPMLAAKVEAGRPVGDWISAHLDRLRPGDYVAVLAFLPPSAASGRLTELRTAIRQGWDRPVASGWGPRYLHSSGQLYKGGPATGVFLVLTWRDSPTLAIPERDYDFAQLVAAQAAGDVRALIDRGRRVLHVDLCGPLDQALASLVAAVETLRGRLS